MTNLNDIIYLSEEQFDTLKSGGSITKDGETFSYDDNSMYAVEVNINQLIIDVVYPVGSIYISVNTSNPSTLFPNTTWVKIEGKFLLGSSSSYTSGSTGGEATHTLTVEEMPSHKHTQAAHKHTIDSLARYAATASARAGVGDGYGDGTYNTSSVTPTINNTGGGQAHNNMPPYLTVNIWKRTA